MLFGVVPHVLPGQMGRSTLHMTVSIALLLLFGALDFTISVRVFCVALHRNETPHHKGGDVLRETGRVHVSGFGEVQMGTVEVCLHRQLR